MASGADSLDEADSLRGLRADDGASLADPYGRRHGDVYRFALRMTGSESIADEVTRTAFSTLGGGTAGTGSGRAPARTLSYAAARREILRRVDLARHHSRSDSRDPGGGTSEGSDANPARPTVTERLTGSPGVDDPLAGRPPRERIDLVWKALLALPVEYREVLVLSEMQGMDDEETARIVESPLATVRSRLRRARELLLEGIRERTHPSGAPPSSAAEGP